MSSFIPLSNVVDAPNSTGKKRYCIRVPDGITKTQIETLGFFRKYDLRGWQPGDLIEALTDFGILGYVITGSDATTEELVISLLYYFTNSVGLVDATSVQMDPAITGGAADGETDVQAALEAINSGLASLSASVAAITTTSIVAAIVGSATHTDAIWGALVARHMTWDGTTLKIDFDNDGSVTS